MARITHKNALFSEGGNRILSFLCDHPHEAYYGVEIALKTFLSRGGTNRLLRVFEKKGLLTTEKRGRMIFYKANLSNPIIRQFKILQMVIFLDPLLSKLKPETEKIILFGSAAKGEDHQESDIDLFIVTGHVSRVEDLIGHFFLKRKIQAVIKTTQEYLVLEKKENIFFKEIQEGTSLWQKD